jgi:hypothetical protein
MTVSRFSRLPAFLGPGVLIAVFITAVLAVAAAGVMMSPGLATTAHAQPVCGLMWGEVEVCIELTPETDSNLVGTPHTVTATVTEDGAVPSTPLMVDFTITGANAGTVGSCSPNADCSVDALLGQVDLTYTPIDHALGTDIITGCIVEPANAVPLHSGAALAVQAAICDDASKDWYVPTPTPAATPTPTATPAPSPTPEAAAPAAELPGTGGEPSAGSSGVMPWLAAITGAIAVASAGAVWLAYQRRRIR